MAEPSKDTDQSMEDILQSIKRIIADESDPVPPTAGSDVLELTELLAEDAAIPETTVAGSISIDEIMAGPISPVSEPEPEAPVMASVEPAPMAAEPVVEPAAPAPAFSAPAPAHAVDTDSLISDATLAASVSALSALAQKPSPAAPSVHGHAFRSGTTVEDLVVESLRPMLKEWLDDHLPALVRNLVEKEIRRLSA